ncbi:undecaprenyldiphospho-muramoylpentapeptide beta-N-acetylglucosaminyltransferase [Laceyella sacchari]|jgi:UDP-N-acetylglucosamine--N-acetylmuramyl-(pentapeptide) pyrophosphoryl-undecaprenol N-acetylglucosamine transferase|uniref:UDP-N-acetylglucosamine--N-acetylmuramyl-(pentapeptide) pyrophosphoryl-undecaprenol N-acetylglucosamine transferase n=2 Tax=Laceyella TaxID=292635 RepID=A0AA45WSI0_9BACL|nr:MULTISPECIES: undecaprenyldiphospho-muramoylpentapeptide beta-N-acetylglucosaminyltransferase [Laceyella]AUS07792.1 undecaprenyldiphospho-muramoylpentapeptide beta-N-acetylglucosaminyltransferase [Laceyella sacchari]MRG29530.1 undecaprenyldiphospho-muramoylpentapeptide beta-N-acetylglucosaminyltransferase [Laceyella tengchongensis]PRZ11765.1 UDP-N-acetylglucosamine-N-acetylmuramylpentapeptide N-acetylglucosamine transferase [Laceyella sediminis]SMP36159.1 UDP-N-acetylglucosamine-N-acetylmura
MKKKIIFTGGGTAGHVTVNLALIPKFAQDGWEIKYIGSENGIEKQLVARLDRVPYAGISTGKLRRYFDWNNFKDPFRVIKGIFQAYSLIKREKPNILFSKGGFVSVPVVLAAWLNRVPVIIHESDITPGLANKIAMPFATRICTTFPETAKGLDPKKTVYVGAIIRDELKRGSRERGLSLCGFQADKPVLLIMGGSLGSQKINQVVRQNLDSLMRYFQIVHLCGKGQVDESLIRPGYKQFEYINEELADVMAMADMVISRAGSNSIFEFLYLRKPMLLIPLSRAASRGDQILNAESFRKMGYCDVLQEEELTTKTFLQKVEGVFNNRDRYIAEMSKSNSDETMKQVIDMIKQLAK